MCCTCFDIFCHIHEYVYYEFEHSFIICRINMEMIKLKF